MNITDQHEDYTENQDDWKQILACSKGQRNIKKAQELYLPYPVAVLSTERQTEAFQEDYRIYLANAIFVEYQNEYVEDLTASAFRKEPQIEPAAPTALEYYDYSVVSKDLIKQTLEYGRVFILTDFPAEASPEAVAYTETYPALSVINWETSRYTGVDRLVRVVLQEETLDEYTIYRELIIEDNIYKVRIYHDEEFQEEFIPSASGQTLTEIPGVFVGATTNSPNVDRSPVIGISNSNIAHYKTFAELMSTQTYSGHPQIAVSGLPAGFNKKMKEDNTTLKVGAGQILTIEGDDINISLLEINANTIHFDTLKKLEQSMQDMGLKLKSQTTSGVESSATLKTKNSDNTSKLAAIVNNVELALEQTYETLGMFMGVTYEPEITINKDFLDPSADPQLVSTLSSAEISDTVPAGTTTQYLIDSELLTFEDEEAVIDEIKNGQSDTGPLPGSNPSVTPIKVE